MSGSIFDIYLTCFFSPIDHSPYNVYPVKGIILVYLSLTDFPFTLYVSFLKIVFLLLESIHMLFFNCFL